MRNLSSILTVTLLLFLFPFISRGSSDTIDYYKVNLNGKNLNWVNVTDPIRHRIIDKDFILTKLQDTDSISVYYFSDACNGDCGQLDIGNNQGVTVSSFKRKGGSREFIITGRDIKQLWKQNGNLIHLYFLFPGHQTKYAGIYLGSLTPE